MSSGPQRHQHGVKKNLVEGIGGFLAGAALVLLLRGLAKRGSARQAEPGSPSSTPATTGDAA